MHIIGTAGHVDHGKTALIEALTGINADRLPEEKQRGMTIDLGFAHFPGPDDEPIGVIDVPGHERFIRNMVAGAWSLSCAVLVVAGDDGWMRQSEDHARVLEGMGIPKIICAVTKIDIIDNDILELVTEEAEERCRRVFDREVPVLPVSSLRGDGIDTLRKTIIQALSDLPKPGGAATRLNDGGPAYLCVDRVFTVKGTGTVVTGSLAGGDLHEGDEVALLPRTEKARVRGIQSYYSSIQTALPVSRVACNLQGIKKGEASRGTVITPEPGAFWVEREFIIQVEEISPEERPIKNHMELEFAFGTGHYLGTVHFLENRNYGRVILEEPAVARWLEPCILIRHGGSAILGKGLFIWPGETERHFRKDLAETLKTFPVPDKVDDYFVLCLLLRGWIEYGASHVEDGIKNFSAKHNIDVRFNGGEAVLSELFEREKESLLKLSERRGGISRAEYLQISPFPRISAEAVINRCLEEQNIIQKGQILFSPRQGDPKGTLTPLGKKIMGLLEKNLKEGLELKQINEPGAQKELRNLVRLELAVPLENGLYYEKNAFNRLAESILSGLEKGASFTIPEAKEKTGLSRKYIIPLLNKMEEQGLVKREGDLRIVS